MRVEFAANQTVKRAPVKFDAPSTVKLPANYENENVSENSPGKTWHRSPAKLVNMVCMTSDDPRRQKTGLERDRIKSNSPGLSVRRALIG